MNVEERIRIEPDGSVTAFSGKIEFGQGIRTAFAQLVANELDVPVERVHVVLGDTAPVPFDFGTFGSNSVAQEAPALRLAAAFARRRAGASCSVEWLPNVPKSNGTRPVSASTTRTRSIGTSSSSATSCANAVRIPCPKSILPERATTVPSGSTRMRCARSSRRSSPQPLNGAPPPP